MRTHSLTTHQRLRSSRRITINRRCINNYMHNCFRTISNSITINTTISTINRIRLCLQDFHLQCRPSTLAGLSRCSSTFRPLYVSRSRDKTQQLRKSSKNKGWAVDTHKLTELVNSPSRGVQRLRSKLRSIRKAVLRFL